MEKYMDIIMAIHFLLCLSYIICQVFHKEHIGNILRKIIVIYSIFVLLYYFIARFCFNLSYI